MFAELFSPGICVRAGPGEFELEHVITRERQVQHDGMIHMNIQTADRQPQDSNIQSSIKLKRPLGILVDSSRVN